MVVSVLLSILDNSQYFNDTSFKLTICIKVLSWLVVVVFIISTIILYPRQNLFKIMQIRIYTICSSIGGCFYIVPPILEIIEVCVEMNTVPILYVIIIVVDIIVFLLMVSVIGFQIVVLTKVSNHNTNIYRSCPINELNPNQASFIPQDGFVYVNEKVNTFN